MSDDKPRKSTSENDPEDSQRPSTSETKPVAPFKRPQDLYPKPIVIKKEKPSPPRSSTESGDKTAPTHTKDFGTKASFKSDTQEACLFESFGETSQFEIANRAVTFVAKAGTENSKEIAFSTRDNQFETDSDSEGEMSSPRFVLDKENYETWIIRMKSLLVEKKLWLPLDTDFATADQAVKDKAAEGFAKIIKHCDDDAVRFLEANGNENSVIALKALENRKEGQGPISKVQIINEIAALKWTGGPLEDHIDKLQQKYRLLSRKGFDVPEIIQVSNLMCSVGDKFSGVFSSFITGDEDRMTFDKISRALLIEQCRQKVANDCQPLNASASLATQPRKSYSSRTKELRKQRGTCTFCKRVGHDIKECWLKDGRPQQRSQKKPNQKANSANIKAEESSGDDEPSSLYSHRAFHVSEVKRSTDADLRSIIKKKKQLRSVVVVPPHSSFGQAAYNGRCNDDDIEADIDNVSAASQSVLSIEFDESFELNKEHEIYSLSCINSPLINRKRLSDFIVDSGASIHMSYDKSLFVDFKQNQGRIKIANGVYIPILGYGTINLRIKTSEGPLLLKLSEVAYAPELHVNLISVYELNKAGHSLLFDKFTCKLKSGKKFVDIAFFNNNNYKVKEDKDSTGYLCLHDWHRRLAHRNLRDIKYLKNHGLHFTKCSCLDECEACIKGKSSEKPFRAETTVDRALDVISTDLCGPFRTRSLGGAYYFLTLTDAYTDFTTVKFLRQKSDAAGEIKNFVAFLKCQLGRTMKCLRSDGGLELRNSQLSTFLESNGIRQEFTTPYSPQSNGRAERKNRTLVDAARTLLISSQLPNFLWAEAIGNAVYTQNRIVRNGKSASPIELFFGKKARATFIEFGAPVYVNSIKPGRGKLDPHATEMKFLSVDEHSKGFRVWDGKRVILSRNVKQKLSPTVISFKPSITNHQLEDPMEDEIDHETITEPALESNEVQPNSSNLDKDKVENKRLDKALDGDVKSKTHSDETTLRRSERLKNKAKTSLAVLAFNDAVPKTVKQALSSPDAARWIEAMEEEIDIIKSLNTYELADLPSGRKPIGYKWIFTRKLDELGDLGFKARLVAQGFSQKFGQDYNEVFAPVVRPQTIRLLLSLAGKMNLLVNQFDVKSAFLNGELKEELYMKQPEGFAVGDQVWRLRKTLYGLKQAARSWNMLLTNCLMSTGFVQSDADECLFIKRTEKGISFLTCHVDDFLLASSEPETIVETAAHLRKSFQLKDLGPVKKFLGIEITRHPDGHFSLSQQHYIEDIAQQLQLLDCKAQKVPLDPGYYKLDDDKLLANIEFYRQVIGKLLYVSTNTRPDISASVCILAQRVAQPRELDLKEALRIVKYLVGTRQHKLHLNNDCAIQGLTVFSDANFGECRKDGKSNSGVICFVNGGAISWFARKQSYVAVSTCEAELYSVSEAVKEIIWLRKLIHELIGPIEQPTLLFNDNRATICKITNGNFMQRTKYVGVRYHFIADWIKRDIIDLQHCATEYNVADLLTKPLNGVKITTLRSFAGLLTTNHQPSAATTSFPMKFN